MGIAAGIPNILARDAEQAELKEIKTGSKTNRRFRAAETVAKAPLGPDQFFQFLYHEGDNMVLMHNTSFEQVQYPLSTCSLAVTDSSLTV